MKRHIRMFSIILIIIMVTLACQVSGGNTNSSPDLKNTQDAMALTLTAMSGGQTGAQPTQRGVQAATDTLELATPTNTPKAPAAQDIQAMINSSNILVYEEIAGYAEYITYVARALNRWEVTRCTLEMPWGPSWKNLTPAPSGI